MFATSDWEPDVPKGAVNFGRKAIKNKDKKQTPSTTEMHFSNNVSKSFPTKKRKDKSTKPTNLNATMSNSLKRNGIGKTFKTKLNKSNQVSNTFDSKKLIKGNKTENSISKTNNHNRSNLNGKNVNVAINKTGITLNPHKKQRKFNDNSITKSEDRPVKKHNKTNKTDSGKMKANTNQTDEDNVSSGELKLSGNNPRKRKLNTDTKSITKSKKSKTALEASIESFDISNFDLDMPDEVIIEKKKKQLNEALKQDREDLLFSETCNKPVNNKKERLKKLLNMNIKEGLERNKIKTSGLSLRARMLEKLKAAQFRYLNEKLYTSTGSEAQQLFQSDPAAFQTYHEGYQLQLNKWPVNPLDVIIKSIQKLPKTALIADMGCGEAKLAKRVQQKVRSFDLVSAAEGVEACDMARTPLLTSSVDAAVYCLALMGTDLTQYLVEANRVLKTGGLLLIAEVESRFEDADLFSKEVQRLGFKLLKLDKRHEVFFFMEYKKVQDAPKKAKLPALVLKPCLYKRR